MSADAIRPEMESSYWKVPSKPWTSYQIKIMDILACECPAPLHIVVQMGGMWATGILDDLITQLEAPPAHAPLDRRTIGVIIKSLAGVPSCQLPH